MSDDLKDLREFLVACKSDHKLIAQEFAEKVEAYFIPSIRFAHRVGMFQSYHDGHPGSWGELHVAMDDGNLDTDLLKSIHREIEDPVARKLCWRLVEMTEDEREELFEHFNGYKPSDCQ